MSRTVNVGTIGHIDPGKTTLAGLLVAVAAAGFLHASQPMVMPERRREFEPGYDLNDLLDDAGHRAKRKARKADRKARMQELQRAAVTG
jgi:hypothetical protein